MSLQVGDICVVKDGKNKGLRVKIQSYYLYPELTYIAGTLDNKATIIMDSGNIQAYASFTADRLELLSPGVINLFSKPPKKETPKQDKPVEEVFVEVMKRNEERKAKQAQERAEANKAVLLSYRIRTKK